MPIYEGQQCENTKASLNPNKNGIFKVLHRLGGGGGGGEVKFALISLIFKHKPYISWDLRYGI